MRLPPVFICGTCGETIIVDPLNIAPCPNCGALPNEDAQPPVPEPLPHEFQEADGFPNTNDIVKVNGGYGIINRVLWDTAPTEPNQPTDAVELKCLFYDRMSTTGEIEVHHNVHLRESISLSSRPSSVELGILWSHLIEAGMKYNYPSGQMRMMPEREGCNHGFIETADECPMKGEVMKFGSAGYGVIDNFFTESNVDVLVLKCLIHDYTDMGMDIEYIFNVSVQGKPSVSDKLTTQQLNTLWANLESAGLRYNTYTNTMEQI